MNDLISRQAAIEAIDRYYKDKRYITRSRTILSAICQDMKSTMDSLPSAQPERKTGEWITHYYKLGTERYECNVCHNRIGDTPYYCPNCGADMRGEQNG